MATIIAALLGSPLIEKWVSTGAMTPTLAQTSSVTIATSTGSSRSTPTSLLTEITDAKGVPMVLVSAGEFAMGNNLGDSAERPAHAVYLDYFYIDNFEVTNAFYQSCVDVGVCDSPIHLRSNSHVTYYGNSDLNNYPVIYVNWYMAKIYCEWRGARLPTAAEFEKAARGVDGHLYPWGEGISCSNLNYSDCTRDTTKVGTYESGKSTFGAYDMSGNVWEWVWDIYDSSLPSFVLSFSTNLLPTANKNVPILMGGAWDSNATEVRSYFHAEDPYFNGGNAFTLYNIGFRCARSVP